MQQNDESAVPIVDATVKNGRLYFPNKESLQYAYDKVKNSDDEVIADYIDGKGIISLRPIVTENNEATIKRQLTERINMLKSNKRYMASKGANLKINNEEEITDDIDDLEEIIGDDAYGAFLNSQAEIQVADEIYKYTDAGLFIVKENSYSELEQYLIQKNISNDLLYPTDLAVREAFVESMPTNQKVALKPTLSYFIGLENEISIPAYNPPSSGGGTGGSTYTPPVVDANVQMANHINSLQNCSTYRTWLQSLFGDSNMCVDQYESRRRVKTKAYNYNYYLVYNLGVKVKHQYKGWTGLWRKEDTDEIRLGVIGATFFYDYSSYFNPAPSTNRITTIYNNNNRYVFDANTFWQQNYFYPGMYTMTGFSTSGYPKLFKDNYYIEDIIPLSFTSSNPIVDQGIYSALQAGNKQLSYNYLNKMFWENVVKKVGDFASSVGQQKPDNNITYSYNALPLGKLLVQKTYYAHQYNANDVAKTFDWGFQVGFSINSDGRISPSTSSSALKKPQEFKVVMYGIAKRNGQWHGSKINTVNQ